VESIEARTEGWIVGLQLAAISMRERTDVAGFIKAFAGSNVFVAEYLMEEVLKNQPQDVKAFLLQTSILARFSQSLCNAVCGISDSQALLRDMQESNLFVIPLDDEENWFRYHQLFADLLTAHLHATASAADIAVLHQHAALWYERELTEHCDDCAGHTLVFRPIHHSPASKSGTFYAGADHFVRRCGRVLCNQQGFPHAGS